MKPNVTVRSRSMTNFNNHQRIGPNCPHGPVVGISRIDSPLRLSVHPRSTGQRSRSRRRTQFERYQPFRGTGGIPMDSQVTLLVQKTLPVAAYAIFGGW